MQVILKDKSTSVVPEYTSKVTTRSYPVMRDGKPAQLRLYFHNGELYALENSHRCGIDRNTDCWDYFNRRCANLTRLEAYNRTIS